MPNATVLLESVDRLADRFRAMPQSRLLAAAGAGPGSRAAVGLALARELAAAAQLAEEGERAVLRAFPDAGAFAVGDQLAVAGHDLAAALAPLAPEAPVPTTDGARSAAAELLAEAVAAVDAVEKLVS